MNETAKKAKWILGLLVILATIGCGQNEEINTRTISEAASGPAVVEPAAEAERVVDPRQAELEARLLASVVRLEIIGGGVSHGTVLGGRYLVTHNHFSESLEQVSAGDSREITHFSLYRADGTPLIDRSPVTNIAIAAEEGETLILDFGELGGQGLFDLFGVPSAHFDAGRPIPGGAEVAQVNWDGARARIDWVPVRESRTEDGVSILVLPNGLLRGASGGGIFYNGRHVANNWSTSRVEGAVTGSVIDTYSEAAVNGGIVAQITADEPVG